MGLEAFPEIESFQKLPRQVIVKGGSSTYSKNDGAELRGIVINNIGHPIRDIRIQVVVLDQTGIPVVSAGAVPDPANLPQGGISSFTLRIPHYNQKISDYHVNANWKFDDSQ